MGIETDQFHPLLNLLESGVSVTLTKQIDFIKDLYCRYVDDEVTALSAQLTYYLILAFFPFLIFLVTIINYTPLTSDQVVNDLISILPSDTRRIVLDILSEILTTKSQTLLSIGMIATIWAASNGIMAIIRGLNKAYDAEETRPFWKVRGMSIIFTLAIIVMIILSFGSLIFGEWIGTQLFIYLNYPDGFAPVWNIIKLIMPIVLGFLIFMFMYVAFPNRRINYKAVIPGALFAAFGWIIISFLFSIYINNFGNYSKVYGSIGGVIVLLIWLYFSSIIMIVGGEINAALQFIREGREKDHSKKF